MSLSLAAAGVATFTSCEDMLDMGNSYVIYADVDHLTSSADTVTSVVGILNKLQAISVRHNLLGEVRADLVKVNDNAILDVKALANFEADVLDDDTENRYNSPRDYYAVINNCNYFLDRVNDSLPEIHTPDMKYMFERETAAVHCIRAWTYLQCVLAYGKVPFIDKPVLTLAESKAEHPMYTIDQICDYFINDLKPYVNVPLPAYNSFDNSAVTPKMCFFPANIVLGDLYLWKAAVNHDVEAAKNSAKSYYDFIVWDLSNKKPTVTGQSSAKWSQGDLNDVFEGTPLERGGRGSFSFGTSGTWGGANVECISAIPMDSSSAKGYYNELKNFYNTTRNPELKEASISPSEALKQLSLSQKYVGYFEREDSLIEINETHLEEEAVEDFLLGDLRFSSIYTTRDFEYNEVEMEEQSISKHQAMNIMVYRVQQIYLRLAEALNYAGYPRFAKQILTMGLSNSVIQAEVQPYYTSPADSAFINYFSFSDTDFMPYAERYTIARDEYGIPTSISASPRANSSQINMIGIHSRGSGDTHKNIYYLPAATPDSTYAVYPAAELAVIGDAPVITDYQAQFPDKPKSPKAVKEPSTWEKYQNYVVTQEEYGELHPDLSAAKLKSIYGKYVSADSVGNYAKYMDEVAAYEADLLKWDADTTAIMAPYWQECTDRAVRIQTYVDAWTEWNKAIYSNPAFIAAEQVQVDDAILTEQALELCYEGNRYYDLMRRAFWYNDPKRLNDPISEARPEVAGKLLDKKNWFLHYKGQIGY